MTPQQLIIAGLRCKRCDRWFCQCPPGAGDGDDNDEDDQDD